MKNIIDLLTGHSLGIMQSITEVSLFPELVLFICLLIMLFCRTGYYFSLISTTLFISLLLTVFLKINNTEDTLSIINPLNWIKLLHDPIIIKIAMAKITLLIILQYNKKYRINSSILFFMLSSLLGSCFLVSFNNILYIFIALEIQALSSYLMIALNKESKDTSEAALKYFISGSLASCIMIYGISLLYSYSGSSNLENILSDISNNHDSLFLNSAICFFFLGLMFKIGLAPYHNWMADVYQAGNPIAVSFIATVPKIAVVFFLTKLTYMKIHSNPLSYVLIISGILSMILGTFSALKQTDIRRILAYSTTSQMGYIILFIAINMLFHQFSNSGLIYVIMYSSCIVGLFAFILQLSNYDIEHFSSLQKKAIISTLFTMIILCIAGIPPFPVFISKFLIMKDILLSTSDKTNFIYNISITIAIMTFSVLSMIYYFRILKNIYFNTVIEKQILINKDLISTFVFALILLLNIFYGLIVFFKIDTITTMLIY